MRASLIIIILLSFSFQTVQSQTKLEREYRIKESAVPADALKFVQETYDGARMKWYAEENLTGKTIEAKGSYKGTFYSVEFDTNGDLLDIEMLIKYSSIPESVRIVLEKDLESRFDKFRVTKSQKQWLGKPPTLRALINGEEKPGQYRSLYELTIRGTRGRVSDYYEILANDRGTITRESKIVQRNNQHLIY